MLRIDVDVSNEELAVEVSGSSEELAIEFSVAAAALYSVMNRKDPLEAEVFRKAVSKTLGNFDSRTWETIIKNADLMIEGGFKNFPAGS